MILAVTNLSLHFSVAKSEKEYVLVLNEIVYVKHLARYLACSKCAITEDLTFPPQATLQKLKAEEYVQQKRELLALYRDRDQESVGTRPSTPSPEGSQSSVEGR